MKTKNSIVVTGPSNRLRLTHHKWLKLLYALLVTLVANTATTASAQDAGECRSPGVEPSIAGVYVDNYGYLQVVTEDFWISHFSLVFELCSVDNGKRRLIARNHSRNEFNPGMFSRFEWTRFKNRLWYCQIVFDAKTPQEAASKPPADTSDPERRGCATFPWSSLVRLLP